MAKYIELEAAISKLRLVEVREAQKNFPAAMLAELKTIPAADVKPVVHSRWEINCDGYYPYCMNCKNEPPGRVMTDFCPNCGADMRGEKNNV